MGAEYINPEALPDLLRVLKKAAPAVADLHWHDIGCPDCDDSGLHCALVDEIHAAITKATTHKFKPWWTGDRCMDCNVPFDEHAK